jgi:hypothetical protein
MDQDRATPATETARRTHPRQAYRSTPALPAEPALHADEKPTPTQPLVGLAGLVFAMVLFVLLAFGAGGAEPSLEVLGPLTTFALPVVAMIAFWWEDWPGAKLRAGWSGLTDTAIVVVAGLLLTVVGQAAVSGIDLRSVLDPEPGPGHVTTFPFTMPVAAGVFTAILQLTLVSEGWPLRRLGRVSSGLAALAVSWLVGVIAYWLVVGTGPVTEPGGPAEPAAYGAWLTCLGAWQLVFFVALRGWPFGSIKRRVLRLPAANIATLACSFATYLALRQQIPDHRITAVCGCLIATLLVTAMLFEAWPWIRLSKLPGRTGVLVTAVALAALLYWGLSALAGQLTWERRHPDDWVAFAALNGLGLGIILQVAIWRRWPLTTDAS